MEGVRLSPETSVETLKNAATELLTFETPDYFIDKGGVGEVFALPSGYCMKLIENRHGDPNKHLYDLGNTPYQEMRLQERASQTAFTGKTRVPKIVGSSTKPLSNGKYMLIMERLPAINLQHIINRDRQLPDNFDIDVFFDDLESFINHLHDSEQIAHNDLYGRNIMIDIQNCNPYVIDFGRAIDLSKVPKESKRQSIINKDWDTLEVVFNEIKALQK